MKQRFKNNVEVRGIVFENNLQARTTGPNSKKPGTPFIMGEVQVALDESLVNVVPVYFTYVPETKNDGQPNETFQVLNDIMNQNGANRVSPEEAPHVRISGNIEANEFYNRDGQLVSAQRIRGSFCHFMKPGEPLNGKATFAADVLLQFADEKPVPNGDNPFEIKGFTFDFRQGLVPVKFTVGAKSGIDFFEGLDITQNTPYFGEIQGTISSSTVKVEPKQPEESAGGFGAPLVDNSRSYAVRVWDVAYASDPLELDEMTITGDEFKKALQDLETKRADEKARAEAYRKSEGQNSGFGSKPAAPTAKKKTSPTKPTDYKF